ncbi:MAG: hypothetical protein J7J71_07160 [Deltaproteobacteria bacterium]|nr:hypothetical protein [Candidatus Tharpella sp.]
MKKSIFSLVVLLSFFLITTLGTSFAAPGGAVSEGNLSVFKNGQLSRNLSGINPVEEGSLLICDGKCMIKSGGVSILAEDQAELAIANHDQTLNLFVRRGHVEFTISSSAKKIIFHTPEGAYSVADVIFNASSDPVVRGYMQVDDSGARVAVREGRMIFATADGAKSVKAGEQIILAMSDVEKKAAAIPVQADANEKKKKKRVAAWWWTGSSNQIAGGVVIATAAVGGTVYVLTRDHGGGGGAPGSPAQ